MTWPVMAMSFIDRKGHGHGLLEAPARFPMGVQLSVFTERYNRVRCKHLQAEATSK
jgi:hypothetical protein